MGQVINWFEIPATDFERATRFYETVFGVKLNRVEADGHRLGIFPFEAPATSGCVRETDRTEPGRGGPLIYLDAGPDLMALLARAKTHGGQVAVDRTHISDEIGDIGVIVDTEGNRIGVHAPA